MRPPILPHARVVRAFERAGFRVVRQGIIGDAGLTLEEFKDLL